MSLSLPLTLPIDTQVTTQGSGWEGGREGILISGKREEGDGEEEG